VLRMGADVEVLSPQSLRNGIRQRIESMASLYKS